MTAPPTTMTDRPGDARAAFRLPQRSPARRWLAIGQRLALAVVGGYFLSAAGVTWGALLLSGVMPRSEAVVLMAMLGFVLYLVVLIWAFAEQRLLRLWLVLGMIPTIGHLLTHLPG